MVKVIGVQSSGQKFCMEFRRDQFSSHGFLMSFFAICFNDSKVSVLQCQFNSENSH